MAPHDVDDLETLVGRLMGYKQGEMVSLMIHVGDRLGLYEAMAGRGAMSAGEFAEITGLQERWLLEWLRGQAAAGVVKYHPEDRFELTEAGALALADANSPAHVAGYFFSPLEPPTIDRMTEAFRTGVGLTWDAHGPNAAHWLSRANGGQHRSLADEVFPLLGGVAEKLKEGATVADVGCGSGDALVALAKQFPASSFFGFDPSGHAIERAEANAREAGVSNAHFEVKAGEDLQDAQKYDLLLTLDVMHDMPYPHKAIEAFRTAIKDDGTWLLKDIKSSPRFEENFKNPVLAMMYAFSVIYCMSSALSAPGGAGLGTLGFNPEVAQQMTSAGGFSRFRMLDYEGDPFNFYYEVRP